MNIPKADFSNSNTIGLLKRSFGFEQFTHKQKNFKISRIESMDPAKFTIQSNFNSSGRFDRSLYLLLALNPLRERLECLYVIALWMWLERCGFTNLLSNLRPLPPFLIHELADEAVACLRGLKPDFPYSSDACEIPMTSSLLDNNLSIDFFFRNRPSAFSEIRDLVDQVCLPSVSDIMEASGPSDSSGQSSSMSCLLESFSNMTMGRDRSIALGKRPAQCEVTPAIDRTLFVTFAKGYPVHDEEVLRFFDKMTFGSPIESFHMHYVGPYEGEFFRHPLYARIIFREGYVITTLLQGNPRGKFFINGKPVWLRKFVQRDDARTDCPCPSMDACVCDR